MTFDKLCSLVLEDYQSEPREISEWDSWIEWLKYFETDISKEELLGLKAKFNLIISQPIKNKIVKLEDNKHSIWLEYDSNELFDVWAWDEDDLESNIQQLHNYQISDFARIDEDDLYLNAQECTLRELKQNPGTQNPGTVYHYTTEEKWEEIQATGGMKTSYGTGLTNRNSVGIFTSSNIEEHAIGTYGDVCLELNLESFKNNNKLSELDLELEPEVLECELKNLIRHKLGIEYSEEASSDMSPYTIIVRHSIPLKYIKRIN